MRFEIFVIFYDIRCLLILGLAFSLESTQNIGKQSGVLGPLLQYKEDEMYFYCNTSGYMLWCRDSNHEPIFYFNTNVKTSRDKTMSGQIILKKAESFIKYCEALRSDWQLCLLLIILFVHQHFWILPELPVSCIFIFVCQNISYQFWDNNNSSVLSCTVHVTCYQVTFSTKRLFESCSFISHLSVHTSVS